MRRLHLHWLPSPDDSGPSAPGGDLVLVFARSAAPTAAAAEVVFADDLLDWRARSEIEHRVQSIVDALRARMTDADLLEASEYELRIDCVNLLLAHAVGEALRDRGPFDELAPSRGTPAAIVSGVCSALAIAEPPSAPAPRGVRQPPAGARARIAELIVRARAATSSRRSIRVLTLPGLKLGEALGELDSGQFAAAHVAVAAIEELGYGEAAKLILRHRVPALAFPARPLHAVAVPETPVCALTGDPTLDPALARAAQAALANGALRMSELSAVLPTLARLPNLRTIVLPTAALSVTRLLRSWATKHGIRVASFQHGIYGLIEGDGGDRRADVLFGWGPAVAEQVAMWAPPRPRLELVGVPGLARAPRPPLDPTLRRVLVATTSPALGIALAAWSMREDFMDALSDGLARLRAAGVAIELRLHPHESRAEYASMDARAGRRPLPFAPPGPFAQVVTRSDLLVAPYSSVAFEAAALAIPVAMWMPLVPDAIRSEYFLPPLCDELPGTFADAAGFDRLIAQALKDPASGLDGSMSLSRNLDAYIAPLDTRRFAAALSELAA